MVVEQSEAVHEGTEIDRNGMEVLQADECLRLLASHHVGRVALSIGALPVILPVNYVTRGRAVFFRTSAVSKLDAAVGRHVVAFEVDSIDPVYHEGWSVLVTGRAEHITDPAVVAMLEALPLLPWAPWVGPNWVMITAELLSGRRLRHVA